MSKCPYTTLTKQWLKKQGVYTEFIYNLISDGDEPDTLKGLIHKYDIESIDDLRGLIGLAFEWSQTYEGMDYWDKLDDKFNEYLDTEPSLLDTAIKLKIYSMKGL